MHACIRRFPSYALTFSALCLNTTLALAQETQFGGLENEMSREERVATGVSELKPEQLQLLNSWLRERFGAEVLAEKAEVSPAPAAAVEAEVERRVAAEVAAAKAKMKAAEEAVEAQEPFEARIVGGFSGWDQRTLFTLDNGQVWRQRNGSQYRHTSDDNRVRFNKNFLGLWTMEVRSSGRSVGVRRVN